MSELNPHFWNDHFLIEATEAAAEYASKNTGTGDGVMLITGMVQKALMAHHTQLALSGYEVKRKEPPQ